MPLAPRRVADWREAGAAPDRYEASHRRHNRSGRRCAEVANGLAQPQVERQAASDPALADDEPVNPHLLAGVELGSANRVTPPVGAKPPPFPFLRNVGRKPGDRRTPACVARSSLQPSCCMEQQRKANLISNCQFLCAG